MTTPRSKFTVIPFLLAFFVGLVHQPATNVVKVDARGMGIEHEQPWLHNSNGLEPVDCSLMMRLRIGFQCVKRHVLFKPLVAAAASLIVALVVDVHLLYASPLAIGATLTEGQHTGEAIVWEANTYFRKSITVLSGQVLKAGAVTGRVTKGIGRCSVPAVVGTGNGTMSAVFAGPDVQRGNYIVKCTALAANGGTFSVTNPAGNALPAFVMAAGGGGQAVSYTSREVNFTVTDGGTDFAVNDTFTIATDTTAPTAVGTGNGTISAMSLGPDAKSGNYEFKCTTAVANGGTFTVTGPDGDLLGIFVMTAGAGTATAFSTRQINFTLTDAGTDFAAGDIFRVTVFNELNGGKVVAWDPTTFDGRHKFAGVLYAAVDATAADTKGVVIERIAVVNKGALQWGAAITAAQKESAYLEMAARNVVALDVAA